MSSSAGRKRTAPYDGTEPDHAGPPPASRRRLTFDSPSPEPLASHQLEPSDLVTGAKHAHQLVNALSSRIEQAEHEARDLSLSVAEAKQIRDTLSASVAQFYDTPATKGDILSLLLAIDRIGGSTRGPPAADSEQDAKHPSPFQLLPFDVVRLILLRVRDLYLDELPSDSALTLSGVGGWRRFVRRTAGLSSNLREVCKALLASEVVVTDFKALEKLSKKIANGKVRAKTVSRVTMAPRHCGLNGPDRDLGFMIPDLLASMSNLTYLNITVDRTTYSLSDAVLRGRPFDFDAFTGGVDVADIIVDHLQSLRELTFGVPTTLATVAKFTSTIPTLRELSVVGEVERVDGATVPFSLCSPLLRRLWLPTTILGPGDLGDLLGVDVTKEESIAGLASSSDPQRRLDALAFCFDVDDLFSTTGTPITDTEIAHRFTYLENVFSHIGRDLTELHVSTPGADHPDAIRMRLFHTAALGGGGANRLRGPGQGGGAGGAPRPPPGAGAPGGANPLAIGPPLTLTFAVLGNPPHGAPAAPPAGNAVPQPGQRAGAPPLAGGQAGQGMGNGPTGQAVNGAAAAGNPGLGRGLRNLLGLGGGNNAGAPNRPHVNAGAPNIGPAQPAAAAGPAGALRAPPVGGGAAGGGAGLLGNGFNLLFGGQPLPPAVPFFGDLVAHCPNLERLELFGRRYDAALVDTLRHHPLRRLSVSVPNDTARAEFVTTLIAVLDQGAWPDLRR